MTRRRVKSSRRPSAGAATKAPKPVAVEVSRPKRAVVVLSALAASVLTVVMLSASFAPFNLSALAFVALVPWLATLCRINRLWLAAVVAWAGGMLFWLANLYWLTWITFGGYLAAAFYLSWYWLAGGLMVRWARRWRVPAWVSLPVFWVALEYARSYVISGFPWFFLSHSQWSVAHLIQVADSLGSYGVSFFVALVNGVFIEAVIGWPRRGRRPVLGRPPRIAVSGGVIAVAMAAAMLAYGSWRLGQDTQREGPVIGIVQHAYPISLHEDGETPANVFWAHYDSSLGFDGSGLDLLVWPETMLPSPGLNAELLELDVTALSNDDLRALAAEVVGPTVRDESVESLRRLMQAVIRDGIPGRQYRPLAYYAEQLGELSRRLDAPILAGGMSLHRNDDPIDEADRWLRRNSAMWFDRQAVPSGEYSKIHLVPFSEYVPFKRSFNWLHRLLRRAVPEQMAQLEPGREFSNFTLDRGEQSWTVAAAICYEGTFDRICRRAVSPDGRKAADILANLSNDGWFTWRWGDRRRGSTEHAQHLVQYCFRAVENRVPVIRAVNTGISASIDSNGRVVAAIGQPGLRSMIHGTLLLDGQSPDADAGGRYHGPKVLVDERVSLYSLVGDVFARSVSMVALLMAVAMTRKSWRLRRMVQENNA